MNQNQDEDIRFFSERGFSQKIGFGKKPAVVVIDFNLAFTNPDLPLGAAVNSEIEATNRILNVSRDLNIPVFFTTVSYTEPNLEDAGIWRLKMKGLDTLRAGSPGIEIDPALNRQPNEAVIVKKYASAFFGTDLFSRLVSRQVDTLIITGITTSGCVRSTAVDAVQYGFRPIVVQEAVGDRAKSAHEQSLFDLNAKYADVIPVVTVLNYLHQLQVSQ
ncbi:isochorismatase family protein [Fictibacillus enclensis]|uniref:isochorismatase family protein n=1 Tax=Fictibacillus enclensis TaxID=1017270 RepID=UPI0025A30AED|nr:isochorismatase family protein [Fictibacillus enclensis]MDM5196708.1 isochorismatase family protein [Fictibacillus enclensis]